MNDKSREQYATNVTFWEVIDLSWSESEQHQLESDAS
jgi:hypothetical protein